MRSADQGSTLNAVDQYSTSGVDKGPYAAVLGWLLDCTAIPSESAARTLLVFPNSWGTLEELVVLHPPSCLPAIAQPAPNPFLASSSPYSCFGLEDFPRTLSKFPSSPVSRLVPSRPRE